MPRTPPPLTRITDTSPATVNALARSYAASFALDSFYLASAQFAGLPRAEQEHWNLVQLKQTVHWSLTNPRHEVWAVLEGEDASAADGAVGARDVAALFVLRLPGEPDDVPTPYDEELRRMPETAAKRHKEAASIALTKRSFPSNTCLHVSWLGVDPAHQGKGYGGAMTRYALGRAREAGVPLRLSTHTQENVNFYARYGFASKGSDVWDIGGVPHTFWCLVAEPEAAAQAA